MNHLLLNLSLVTGIPRSGKSSLCDAIEASHPGFTHVPLDRYVKPVPESMTFLEWIAHPDCIAWDHLQTHLEILTSGHPCYTPRPDWDNGWKSWLSDGGAIADGPGRRMEPATQGYLLPGTHSFAYPMATASIARVFVDTPDTVVAGRLTGLRHDSTNAALTLKTQLAANLDQIRSQQASANLVIDGTLDRTAQVTRFQEFHAAFSQRRKSP
jgi:hypothetical protein